MIQNSPSLSYIFSARTHRRTFLFVEFLNMETSSIYVLITVAVIVVVDVVAAPGDCAPANGGAKPPSEACKQRTEYGGAEIGDLQIDDTIPSEPDDSSDEDCRRGLPRHWPGSGGSVSPASSASGVTKDIMTKLVRLCGP